MYVHKHFARKKSKWFDDNMLAHEWIKVRQGNMTMTI